jgi:hypothetical protein
MRPITRLTLAASLIALALVRLAAVASGVHITNIAPASGRAGDLVTITGGGFGALNTTITVGGVRATILTATGQEVTFVVPAGVAAGMTTVAAVNPGERTGTIGFLVLGGGLLQGNPNTPAIDAIFDLAPVAASEADIEAGVIMTRLDVRVAADASVGEVNAALMQLDAQIASMSRGYLSMTISIPRQPTLAALQAVAASLASAPGIDVALLAITGDDDELPSTDAPLFDPQLLATGFPAAWNARSLAVDDLGGCRQPRVPVLVSDDFVRPAPPVRGINFSEVGFEHEIPHFLPSPPDDSSSNAHGYTVTLMLGALFNPEARTGANPFSQCLDITGVLMRGLSPIQEVDRLVQNFPAGKFIINLSRSWPKTCRDGSVTVPCQPHHFGTVIPDAIRRAEDTLWWKQRSSGRWEDFMVAASAGNVRDKEPADIYPALGIAAMNSFINAATLPDPFLGFAQNAAMWTPTDPSFPILAATPEQAQNLVNTISFLGLDAVGGAANVLKVGSTTTGRTYSDLVASDFSNVGHDVSAIGEEIQTADLTLVRGTSFSSPQVAGLASYLWLLSPQLRAEPAALTRRAIVDNAITTAQASEVIDAYATVLSLDPASSPTALSAPIRLAILDVTGDGTFDALDLTAYRSVLIDAAGGSVEPAAADYSRHDLNGDGFTGGSQRTARFDLDRTGSTQFGASSYADVTADIEGLEVHFHEAALTDLEILCYYAYSDLYGGDSSSRGLIMQGLCVAATVTVDPPAVTLDPGGTQQFAANVTGTQDPRVTWTATGGSITMTGLFTAGAAPGTGTVRATSVVDPNAFGDAIVTVRAAVQSNVLIAIGGANAPAGQIRASVGATGFDMTRPLSEMTVVLDALTRELAGVSIATLSVLISEPVAFTYTVGDVARVAVGSQCGATLDLTVGNVRADPVRPGLFGNGVARVVVCESRTRLRLGDVQFLEIDSSRSSDIAVSARSLGGVFVTNNSISTIGLSSDSLQNLFVSTNSQITLVTGNVARNVTIGGNNLPLGLDALGIGTIGGDLTMGGNQGFSDQEAQAWADARVLGGTVTILGNFK